MYKMVGSIKMLNHNMLCFVRANINEVQNLPVPCRTFWTIVEIHT